MKITPELVAKVTTRLARKFGDAALEHEIIDSGLPEILARWNKDIATPEATGRVGAKLGPDAAVITIVTIAVEIGMELQREIDKTELSIFPNTAQV